MERDGLLRRLRGDGVPRPEIDPGLAGGLRDWLEDGLVEAVAALPVRRGVVRVNKESLNQVLLCEAHLVAGREAPRVTTVELARGSLVDALFRQWVTTGVVDDPWADALAAFEVEGDRDGVVAFVAALPDRAPAPADGRGRRARRQHHRTVAGPEPGVVAEDPGAPRGPAVRRTGGPRRRGGPRARQPRPGPGLGVPGRAQVRRPAHRAPSATSTSTRCSRRCAAAPRLFGSPRTTAARVSSTPSRSTRTPSWARCPGRSTEPSGSVALAAGAEPRTPPEPPLCLVRGAARVRAGPTSERAPTCRASPPRRAPRPSRGPRDRRSRPGWRG